MENNENKFCKKDYLNWINSFNTNFTYYNPARPLPGETTESFPIIAGGVKYNYYGVMPTADLMEIKNCGFNVCVQGYTKDDEFLQSLINAKEVGIRITTRNETLTKPLNEFFSKIGEDNYNYIQYLAGIIVFGEPTYDNLMGDNEAGLGLMKEYQFLMKQLIDYNSTNNSENHYENSDLSLQYYLGITLVGAPVAYFMPNPGSWNGDPEYDVYEQYLNAYQQNFKPSFFSYDLYPISEKALLLYEGISKGAIVYDGTEGDINVDFYRFYTTAEYVSNLSSLHERPFWCYCQGTSYMNVGEFKFYRPHALEQYLRYEAFTAIAYGAKAIQYWNYIVLETKPSTDCKTPFESYFSALTNRKNQKTAAWYFARKINNEIKKYEQIFLNSKTKVSEISKSNSYKYSSLMHRIEISTNDEKGVLISELSLKDSVINYLLIVSKDVLHYQSISIKVLSGNIIEITPEFSSGEENKKLGVGTHSRILIPGGYRIIELSYAPVGPVFPPI